MQHKAGCLHLRSWCGGCLLLLTAVLADSGQSVLVVTSIQLVEVCKAQN